MKFFSRKYLCLLGFILVFILNARSAIIVTQLVFSDKMQKEIPVDVVLPQLYSQDSVTHYPVIYLLHGWSGDYSSYVTSYPHLIDLGDSLSMIFVCPDGGYNSWWVDSPIDSSCQYETFVSSELIAFTDSHYRTKAARNFRAVAGLSMGGHGALLLALKHPDVFGAAGSMSGCVNLAYDVSAWGIAKHLGDYKTQKQNWHNNSVSHLVKKHSYDEVPLMIECGRQDFLDDINRRFNRRLDALHINHTYIESDGGHGWDYWSKALPVQLKFFASYFQQEEKNPE